MSKNSFLIYGANGYTGGLIARQAAQFGMTPILAGRTSTQVIVEANGLNLPHRIFSLENPNEIDANLRDVCAVLHCAGPFIQTAKPMVDACLRTGVHYLDITGEIAVFEALAARDGEAKAAGVMLLPGVGFDVVPTDCLAVHLKRRLPTANRLTVAFKGFRGVSRGTAATTVESMARSAASMVRKEGALVPIPLASRTRMVDFGHGPHLTVTIPWGDVSTAYYSTGIPNIETYMAASPRMVRAMKAGRWLGWLLRLPFLVDFLKYNIHAASPGPREATRLVGEAHVWARVEDASGRCVESRLVTPEAYTLTALSSLKIMEKVLVGDVKPGFQTPALAYGADLVLEINDVAREDTV
jgi:short subunit dehydrogenase-like uncharacterized protein